MKMAAVVGLGMMAAALTPALQAQTASPQLTYVLKQMDTASAKFQRATADFQWDYYERVVRDTTTQNGTIYFEHQGSGVGMGAVVTAPGMGPKGKPKVDKVIEYKAGTLQMFDPSVDQITVLRAGANQAEYEGFLTLGFGGSGTELARAWQIADLGPEMLIDAGQPVKTEKLDLTAKDAKTSSMFTHITIWVDPTRAVSLKQVFFTSAGNYRTALYSHIQVNGNVHKDEFAIKRDKNTTVVSR
jgi:outer membrane lipoprotein-sorting protein